MIRTGFDLKMNRINLQSCCYHNTFGGPHHVECCVEGLFPCIDIEELTRCLLNHPTERTWSREEGIPNCNHMDKLLSLCFSNLFSGYRHKSVDRTRKPGILVPGCGIVSETINQSPWSVCLARGPVDLNAITAVPFGLRGCSCRGEQVESWVTWARQKRRNKLHHVLSCFHWVNSIIHVVRLPFLLIYEQFTGSLNLKEPSFIWKYGVNRIIYHGIRHCRKISKRKLASSNSSFTNDTGNIFDEQSRYQESCWKISPPSSLSSNGCPPLF